MEETHPQHLHILIAVLYYRSDEGKLNGKESVFEMMMTNKRSKPLPPLAQTVLDYGYILVGSAIVAVAFNLFLLPNRIASGGVSGISTIVYDVFGNEPAFTQWAFNIPLFILGILLLGGMKYGVKTLVGTLFLPYVVFLTRHIEPATLDPFLGALFGGIGVFTILTISKAV